MIRTTKGWYFAAALIAVSAVAANKYQEKRVALPPVTEREYGIIRQALQECDCPVKSTGVLLQSFDQAVLTQAPAWFGRPELPVDSTKKKGGKP